MMKNKALTDLKAFLFVGLALVGWLMIALGTLLVGFLLISLFAKGLIWVWHL